RFVILETGFGAGLNFAATWAAWRDDAQRCAALHFISIERYPLRGQDLARIHAHWPQEWQTLSAELRAAWPMLTPGLHRLHLNEGAVTLDLFFGDVEHALTELRCAADAIYLDGFAPAKNPQMWTPRVAHLLSHCAAPQASVATWSVSGSVREALQHAGFACEKAPGFGDKREMLRGELRRPRPRPAAPAERAAIVLGAGLAGTGVAARLAAKGWQVAVIDRADAPATGASGNPAGVMRPLPSLDDNRLSQLTRAGSLYTWPHLAALAARGAPVRHARCGALHLARDAEQEERMQRVMERLALPEEVACFVTREAATELAGQTVARGGWHFARAGWVCPHELCAAQLAAWPQQIRTHFGREVARCVFADGQWRVQDAEGNEIACAPHLVLACGTDTPQFAQAAALPVRAARGQVSFSEQTAHAPQMVVCCGGYATPAVEGMFCFGATFDTHDTDTSVRAQDHEENLRKLAKLLPEAPLPDAAALRGRTSFRPASPDRMPIVGALPNEAPGLWVATGYGARGLVFSALIGEHLASLMDGAPSPLPARLQQALNPVRFLVPKK
ncbi:MAG: FAD-dependent 5-carboxymethylaminomethyl-2-thiouridine(34) oxidoreductase MnmC, partial [Rhodocyclaceae bacterium]|nr:FAD-dependent 5-carboxymethylaminomethyl-2-thiouridine(34) oxidoreductase MnmC [Rhodocyclaceae bacterium]